jgi:uncharacterized repeat protein (TIGR03847 family)
MVQRRTVMPRLEIDLNPVTHITADAVGQPGQRVFYIQGQMAERTVTLIVEKLQIQTLALGAEEFLREIASRYPGLAEASSDYDEAIMHIQPPVDPLFRVGELALAYDTESDQAIVIAREIAAADESTESESDTESEEEEEGGVVRFWCKRSQLLAMCQWGLEVANRGRPTCPYCGQPIDPGGHFCPKRNGHKH